jgi:hypothetical protein
LNFDPQEPWQFLELIIESTLTVADTSVSSVEGLEDSSELGSVLVLQYLTSVLERDMMTWHEAQLAADSLTLDYRPLLSHVLFPHGQVSWGRRLDKLCCYYVRGLDPSLRTMVGLATQLLDHTERLGQKPHNSCKLSNVDGSVPGLPVVRGRAGHCQAGGRSLLQPAWLAALVSAKLHGKLWAIPAGYRAWV